MKYHTNIPYTSICTSVCHIVCLLLCHIYAHLNRPDRRTASTFICCVTLTAAQRLSCCPQLIVCLFNECLRSPLPAPCCLLCTLPSVAAVKMVGKSAECKYKLQIANCNCNLKIRHQRRRHKNLTVLRRN